MAVLMSVVMVLGLSPASAFAEGGSQLAAGKYSVPITTVDSGAPLPAVKEVFAGVFGDTAIVESDGAGNLVATLHPQHMVANIGGDYNCNLLTITGGEITKTRTDILNPKFGDPSVSQEIEVPAEIVVPLPAEEPTGGYKLEVTVDMMNIISAGALENPNLMDVVLHLDFENAEELKAPAPAVYTVKYNNSFLGSSYTIILGAGEDEDPAVAAYVNAVTDVKVDGTSLKKVSGFYGETMAYKEAAHPSFGYVYGIDVTEDVLKTGEKSIVITADGYKDLTLRTKDGVLDTAVPQPEPDPEPEAPKVELKDSYGTAAVTMLNETKDEPSMCNDLFTARADVVIKGDDAEIKILVGNPVPAFADQGKDGTVKNVKVSYNGQQYEVDSDLGTDAWMTARNDNALFGLTAGEKYTAQVLTVTLPKEALLEDILKVDAYVNVVMNADVVFRMQLTDFQMTEGEKPVPEAPMSPSLSPEGAEFPKGAELEVKLLCGTDGAVMYYTTDGTTPSNHSILYDGTPIIITDDTTIKVIAYKDGVASISRQGQYTTYTINAPVITPDGGEFTDSQEITMSCDTEKAKIYYTLDGSEPALGSNVYDGPFTITESADVKAAVYVNYRGSDAFSDVTEAKFTKYVPVLPEAPAITPEGGIFKGEQSVSLSCTDEKAKIYYTLDGSVPTDESILYEGAFTITEDTVVKAIAYNKDGASDVTEARFTKYIPVLPKAPVIAPDGGEFKGEQNVLIRCEDQDAEIYYTLDGTEPTNESMLYEGVFVIKEDTVVKAIAYNKDGASEVTEARFKKYIPALPAAPVIAPKGGEFRGEQSVSLSCADENVKIYYTLDGSIPTDRSTLYEGAFTITEDTVVKAVAYNEDGASEIAEASFTKYVPEAPYSPVISPRGGTFEQEQWISLNCGTKGATIYYTLDGTEPTDESMLYEGVFVITEDTVVKAVAYSEGVKSAVSTAEFTRLDDGSGEPEVPDVVTPKSFKVKFVNRWGITVWQRNLRGLGGIFAPIVFDGLRPAVWEAQNVEGLTMRSGGYINARRLAKNYVWYDKHPVITFTIAD